MAVHDPTPVRECILSVLVENRSGVLSHVVGLFSARGFNIDSLAVGETEDPTMSRITLVSRGDQRTIEQIKKQLNKLIDVIKIQDLTEEEFVDRELMIVKFKD
ncbi:MAG TPA: acetolactate synthase small subunit, partial [Candidatus Omnitrophota bacterium]|nr:acetolactate synthase small subunit [Candidatus Omnitrophota bacterium]